MGKEASRLDFFRYDLATFLVGEKKYQVQPIIRITTYLHLGWLLIFGVYSYAGVVYLRLRKIRLESLLLLTIFGLGFYVVTLYFRSEAITAELVPRVWDTPNMVSSLGLLWLYLIPSAPVGALLMAFWDKMKEYFRPNTIEVQVERREQAQQKEDQIRRQKAGEEAVVEHSPANGFITLGPVIRGDSFPKGLGVETFQNRLRLEDKLLNRHVFVLGTTGAGKTETLLRIIAETLYNTNRSVYFVDGKGDTKLAGKIATLIYNIKGEQVPVFKLGHNHDGAIYNGFAGSVSAIYNRLAEMAEVNEVEGNAKFYADLKKRVLQLICGLGHPELGIDAPRSFDEVLDRIDYSWLGATYKDVPRARRFIEMAKEEAQIIGLLTQMSNLSASFGHIINPEGFTLEATKYAIFSLKTPSAGVDAKSFLDFFVTDIKDGIANRFTRPTLLIIDEFGTFKNQNITEVLSLARGSETACILATQDIASLGDEQTRKKILANSNTHILMKTNYPEDLASLAGTVMRIEASHQLAEGTHTGMGSARLQHQFKIDPNEVGKMTPGEAFLINSRYAAKIRVSQVNNIQFRPESIAPIVVEKKEAKPPQKAVKPEATKEPERKEDNLTYLGSIRIDDDSEELEL